MKTYKNMDEQRGFTLIEMLVTLLLGGLISAAVLQVFITTQQVDGMQKTGSEIQGSSIFGIQSMERQIRLANLGNDGKPVSDTTLDGGIVLTADDGTDDAVKNKGLTPFNVIAKSDGAKLETGYLTVGGTMTVGGEDDKWSGKSNTQIKSDQLTIQYTNDIVDKKVNPDKNAPLYDCSGTKINDGETVIQRYFLKASGSSYDLMCEAGRIVPDAIDPIVIDKIENFGNGNGTAVVIIDDVDQFNVRFGVSQESINKSTLKVTNKYYDLSIDDYMKIDGVKPFITSIKIAILARSSSNAPEGSGESFMIFGKEQTLKEAAADEKVMRRVFETNILLRNARFMSKAL